MTPPWLIELPTCASTNSWAQTRLASLEHGSCVYTRRQSAGRGQYGRSWCSAPGVLTCSFVLHLRPSPHTPRLALVAGLAVAHAVEDLLPDARVMLKWPNDCHCLGRKLAGILCEGRSGRDGHHLCVGIGCNVDPDWDAGGVGPDDFATAPIALAELGCAPDPLALIAAMRRYLLEGAGLLAAGAWPQLLAQIRARDALDGRALLVVDATGAERHGTGAGIADDGALLLCASDGGLHRLDSGSVRPL